MITAPYCQLLARYGCWMNERIVATLRPMPDDARKREMLYQHDIGVTRIRRVLLNKAKAQVATEDAAQARSAG